MLVPNPRRPKRPEPWEYDTDAEWKKADDLWDEEYDKYNEKEQAFLTWESKMDEYDAANPTGSIEWDMYYNGDANYKNALESINDLLRNPEVNVRLGALYFNNLLEHYDNNIIMMVTSKAVVKSRSQLTQQINGMKHSHASM